MDQSPPTIHIDGQFADHPNTRLIAKAIITTAQEMEDRAQFLQQLRTDVPGITPGELHSYTAYFWQGEPFIAITHNNQLAYRISEQATALPLPRHLAHWTLNGKALPRWRVLAHDGPRDWMPTAIRALELVKSESGDVAARLEESDPKV